MSTALLQWWDFWTLDEAGVWCWQDTIAAPSLEAAIEVVRPVSAWLPFLLMTARKPDTR